MPNEIFTINLNAQAIIPEAFILLGIVGTLLVDLAGEKTASKWAPIICYLSIGSSLISLALQWSNPVESAFLGSFNSDNLAIAFRAIISLSTLVSLLISWRTKREPNWRVCCDSSLGHPWSNAFMRIY